MLLVIIAAMIVGSPYWALYQLKNAYNAKNATTINHYIDFPSVQSNLKQQLKSALIPKVKTLTSLPILQALNINIDADAIVTKMINQAVDNTVTANGVKSLLNGQSSVANLDNNAKLLGGLTAVAMDKIEVKALITARGQDELMHKITEQLSRPNPNAIPIKDTATYCGFNCFAVQTQVKGYPITVTMQRQGLINWKIVGIKLPF